MSGSKASPCVFMLILIFEQNDAGMHELVCWFKRGEDGAYMCEERDKQSCQS